MDGLNLKKENKVLKIIAILLIVLVIVAVGYVTYNKFFKDTSNKNNEVKEEKKIGSYGYTSTSIGYLDDEVEALYINENGELVYENYLTNEKTIASGIKGKAKYLTHMGVDCSEELLRIAVLTENGEVFINKYKEFINKYDEEDNFISRSYPMDFIKLTSGEKIYGVKSTNPVDTNAVATCGSYDLYVYNKDGILKEVILEEQNDSEKVGLILVKATVGKAWNELYTYKKIYADNPSDPIIFVYDKDEFKIGFRLGEESNFVVDEAGAKVILKNIFAVRIEEEEDGVTTKDEVEKYYIITKNNKILYVDAADFYENYEMKNKNIVAKKYNNKIVKSINTVKSDDYKEKIIINYSDKSKDEFLTGTTMYNNEP